MDLKLLRLIKFIRAFKKVPRNKLQKQKKHRGYFKHLIKKPT